MKRTTHSTHFIDNDGNHGATHSVMEATSTNTATTAITMTITGAHRIHAHTGR